MLLIDEYILPSQNIISELLALRGASSDQVDNEYPTSESDTEEGADMATDAPVLLSKRELLHP